MPKHDHARIVSAIDADDEWLQRFPTADAPGGPHTCARKASVLPDAPIMNPLAGPAPLTSAAPGDGRVASRVRRPPAPEAHDEEWVEPEIPYRPEPSRQQRPAQRNCPRSGGRQHRQGSGGRVRGNGRRSF